MKSDIHEIEVIYQHRTDRAVCVRETEDGDDIWIPLSMCEIEAKPGAELRRGRLAILTSDEATLTGKGLI